LGNAKAKMQAYNFTDWINKAPHANINDINKKIKITEALLEIENGQLVWKRWGDMPKATPTQLKDADKVIANMLSDRNIMIETQRTNQLLINDLEWHAVNGTGALKDNAIRRLPIARQMQELINILLQ
jgi:hypothetical protein